MLEATALRFGTFLFLWLIGCFAFGAIATLVNKLDDADDYPLRDSHQKSRENLGAIFSIGVITFAVVVIGIAASLVVTSAITKVVGREHFAPYFVATSIIETLLVATVVSWLGMSIPFVLRGGLGVWDALRKSLLAAAGYEGFLFLLVVQSLIGSYVGWYALRYFIWAIRPTLLFTWNGWLFLLLSTLMGAAVEPPIFIGLALLADEKWAYVTSSDRS